MGVCSYFTCSARANIPAANGAEAEVPVCLDVQLFCISVVTCAVQIKVIKLFGRLFVKCISFLSHADIYRSIIDVKSRIEVIENILF